MIRPVSGSIAARGRPARKRPDLLPYALLAPSLLALGLVILYPVAQAIVLSVEDVNLLKGGLDRHPFDGLNNFQVALGMSDFWNSLAVSLIYATAAVLASYVLGLFLALLLNGAFRGRAIARALAIAPWAMPPVVTSIVWLWMYDQQFGVINYLLRLAHLVSANVGWLTDPTLALPSVILVTVWKSVPLAMIVLLAGLQGIPNELYEAARIDGAGVFAEFRSITLPGLRPVSSLIVLMLSLWTFKEFTYVYVLTGGGPGNATETLVLQVYYQAFKFLQFGLAAAIGVLVMLICLIFSAFYLPLVYGRGSDGKGF